MILNSIEKPADLKKLTLTELIKLCEELRTEIVRLTNKNGGHLGSNLGAVELIVAAHRVFDCEIDRFLFDVGHQAYAHKLLTGRQKLMENLRNAGGASGFPDPDESKYDHFIAGHASTSLSAALGIAKARDLKRANFKVVSLIGDGSLSGGMAFEAMNNVAGTRDFIVILNDNQMSISESVGTMQMYLSKLLCSKNGLILRKKFRQLLSKMQGKSAKFLEALAKNLLAVVGGKNLFEELGFQYIGPIDGHNLSELIEVLESIRDIANYKPVLIHVVTQKGKGHNAAEHDPTKMHSLDKSRALRYSDVFGQKITSLAAKNQKIICITAAMKNGCGLNEFAETFPDRFFDVGIAEGHAVTFAAGLAREGMQPFVCIYSTFLQRAVDQIYHDIVLQNLPVRFIIDKAGMPGNDGKTHAGLYDTAILQNFPNITIMSPSSRQALCQMLDLAAGDIASPLAIRFQKAEAYDAQAAPDSDICSVVVRGTGTLVISCGNLLGNILEAVSLCIYDSPDLQTRPGSQMRNINSIPTVLDMHTIQPFDFEVFYKFARTHERIMIFEEGVFGGISNIILEHLIANNETKILQKIRFYQASKEPPAHMTREQQLQQVGMSPEKIAEKLLENVQH